MNKIMKVIIAVICSCAITISCVSVGARQIYMHINDNGVVREVCQVWGFDMLPILDIANELGFEVEIYYDGAILFNDYNAYAFVLDDPSVYDYYGNWYGLDVVPQYINGRLMVPAKFFIDNFGYSYIWDPIMDYIFINSVETYNTMVNSREYLLASYYITNEFKQQSKRLLGIPNSIDTTCIVSLPYYWDAGQRYAAQLDFLYGAEYVAGATFDIKTGEKLRNIYNFSGIN